MWMIYSMTLDRHLSFDMIKYDFDKLVDRHGTGALKTHALQARFGDADLLPLWVAAMDFETPPFII